MVRDSSKLTTKVSIYVAFPRLFGFVLTLDVDMREAVFGNFGLLLCSAVPRHAEYRYFACCLSDRPLCVTIINAYKNSGVLSSNIFTRFLSY